MWKIWAGWSGGGGGGTRLVETIDLEARLICIFSEFGDEARAIAQQRGDNGGRSIPGSKPDHLRRRTVERSQIGEIRVQRDDGEAVQPRKIPDGAASASASPMRRTWAEPENTSSSSPRSRWLRFWSNSSFIPQP